MRDLLRSKHFVVTVDDARIVRRVRTAERFASVEEIESAYDALVAAFDAIDRTSHAQLVDVRLAMPRNDAEFEGVVNRHHAALYRGFLASAALVQTAAGKLQMKRMLDASQIAARTFDDEAEAVAYLRAALRGKGELH